jgi:hypothetical protein
VPLALVQPHVWIYCMKRFLFLFSLSVAIWGQRLPTTGILTLPCSDVSGSTTAQSCSTSPSYTIAATNCVNYTTTTSNMGDLTVAVNGGSAAHVRKWLGSSVLASGDMPGNETVLMCFDGTYWETSTIGNAPSGGGGSAFSSLTGGTNSTASMVVGTGASLAPSGSGTIQATALATVGGLPSQANATFVANVSGGSASPTAASLPTTANALVKTNNANGALAASSVIDNGTTVTTTEPVVAASFSSGSSAPSVAWFTGTGGLEALYSGTCTGTVPSGANFICDNSGVPLWMSSSSSTIQLVLTGDDINTSNQVVKINGASIPASAAPLCSNSSSQPVNCTVSGTGTTVVLTTSPTLITPALGTPASGVMTNMTGLPGHQIAVSLTAADTSGSGTAQSATTSPSFTPAANDCVLYTTTTTNSGTGLTTNIDSLGAKSIAISGSSGWTTTLPASIIPTGKPLLMCYDGTNWDIQQTGTVSSGGSNSITGSGLTIGDAYFYSSSSLTPAIAYGLAPGNSPTPLTLTFTNSSASISASNTLVAGTPVQFQTTGSLPTNFATSTTYFVISTGLTTSAFEVSATYGGSAITAGSAGSGTQTATVVTAMPAVCVASSSTACVFSGTITTGTWTAGGVLYLSDATSGALTQTIPSASGHFIQRIGVAISSSVMLVIPSLDVGTIQ